MHLIQDMPYKFERLGDVGIFTLNGELQSEHEDDLKLLLMRAMHSIERAVLNFKSVTEIDGICLQLLNRAYCASVRLKKPLILTNVPEHYLTELFSCQTGETSGYPPHNEGIQEYTESGI